MNKKIAENILPHLENSIPEGVVNHHTSYYTVALEGWRRGLKLTFHNSKRGGRVPSKAHQYTLSDGTTSYRFFCARSSYVSEETIKIAENKTLAYEYMRKNNVPIPETKTFNFSKTSIENICKFGSEIGYPLVVKPTNRGGGKGVFTNIKDENNLIKSLTSIRDDFNSKNVIIEKYFENAVDYRFYVMGDKVLAASKSYSSNVIGDGKSNIRELIKIRNREIKKNVATKSRKINIDDNMKDFLKSQNMSLESVPLVGERIFVREHGTYLGDRLNVDCTDDIDQKFKDYAVQALNSIPGLPCGSVDMIINEDINEGIVNEINSKGEIMMHVLPFEGKARDIPKAIIDYYFPNASRDRNENFYFEFKPIKDLFLTGVADEIVVPQIPTGAEYIKEFTLKGNNLGSSYMRRLRRRAALLNLIGNIKKNDEGNIQIKAIGSREQLDDFEIFIKDSKLRRSVLTDFKGSMLSEFSGVSNINFEII
ncbi:ATP-binding protein [Virgibacillus alimentarius]|uniref:ATP-binding protein n=1 Tax=Virgibacillus alimentarius TaxID=698769 RepID=UPI000492EB79|nr:hypothetical protein [Virgibacillus alimentarius]